MAERAVNLTPRGADISSPGGGGSDMEARLTSLEKSVERMTGKVDSIGERLSRMEGEISRLPGYQGMVVMIGVMVGLVSTVVAIGTFLINNAP
jgi:hypothetical protein